MSDKLEALLENLNTKEAAALMTVTNDIAAAARAEFGIDVPLDDIAGLIQVRDAVFHGGLDEGDMSNALYNLKANSAAICDHLANTAGLDEAKQEGADPAAKVLDGETLMGINSPTRRMALARKHGIGEPGRADRGQRRPAHEAGTGDYDSVAKTINDAIERMNSARGAK